ncbi:hypothetical protein SGPA1_50841 [Streptomyces misionensis JCM 4497]
MGQAAPGAAGSARCGVRGGLVALRDRLNQSPGGQRGPLTGPNPTDRGKGGSKIHVICDRTGLPISVGISAANLHDSQALVPLMQRYSADPLPPRSQASPPSQAPRRQGLRLRPLAQLAATATDRAAHRTPRQRELRPPRSAPLGH